VDQFKKIDFTNSGLLDIDNVEPLTKMLIDQYANKTKTAISREDMAVMKE